VKRSKLFAITLQSKSGLIFFFVLAAYNLLLGVYPKDFFVLSPMLVTLYLLSALPTLFFVLKIRPTPMRAIVYIVLFFVMIMSIVSFAYCSRLLSIMTMVTTAAELMYPAIVDNSSGKDTLLTKFAPVVKPTKKKYERFMIGSYPTSSTTTTAIRFSNTLMFARHCKPSKVFALTFPICFPHFVVVRTFRAMRLTVRLMIVPKSLTLGNESILTVPGGIWI